LLVEALEHRLCPNGGPYLVVTSYATSSVMRYDEITAMLEPAAGQDGATFVAPNSGGLDTPLLPLFTPSGDLIVDSGEDNTITRYDGMTGAYVSAFVDPGSGSLQFPTGMIFSPDGNSFFVASNFNNRIIQYAYDGMTASNPVVLIDDPQLAGPVGLVFGPDGDLYVSCLYAGTILRYDPTTGAPLPGPGQTGANFITPGNGGLVRGGGLTFGPDGNLYVSSQTTDEILRFDGKTGDPLPAAGQTGATFVVSGSGGLSRPAGLVFGPGRADPTVQDLYVVSINTDTIEQFDGTTGNSVGSFIPSQSGGLSKPRGLAFGSTDPSSLLYNPPVPPGGFAHANSGPKFTTAGSAGAAFVGLSTQYTAPVDVTSFGSTTTSSTEPPGQTAAGNESSRGVVSLVDVTGTFPSRSHDGRDVSFLSVLHSATNDAVKPYGPLSTPLVDLLALHFLEG
jgi:WD40 repeat protein